MGSARVADVVDMSAEQIHGVWHLAIGAQADLFIFDHPPEPFDEPVVRPCPLAVNANSTAGLASHPCEA